MKKLFSTSYSETAFNIAMLVLRAGLGIMMIPYGYQKLIHFAERKDRFMNFMGIGSTTSLILVIFAEVICTSLLILGLLSRFAALVLVILTSVIVFKAFWRRSEACTFPDRVFRIITGRSGEVQCRWCNGEIVFCGGNTFNEII